MNATNTPDAVSVPRRNKMPVSLDDAIARCETLITYSRKCHCEKDAKAIEIVLAALHQLAESEANALLAAPPSEPVPEFVERDPGFMPWQIEGVSGWFRSSDEALAAWRKTSEPVPKDIAEQDAKVSPSGEASYLAFCEQITKEHPPEGTVESLGMIARMIRTYAIPELPANEQGQVPFLRGVFDSAVSEIEAFIANQPTSPLPPESAEPVMTFEEALNLLPDYMNHHSECNAASRFKARKDGESLKCDCGADRVCDALNTASREGPADGGDRFHQS